jgi:glycolate oxidase FAD binding subunit
MKAMSSDKPLHDAPQEPNSDRYSALLEHRAPDFTSIVGKDAVSLWEKVEKSHQQRIQKAISDQSAIPPSCIVYPQTQGELAEVVAESYRNQCRILICGSGSKLSWGGLATGIDIVVSTERINRLIEHADGDLTVTVEAGMKFAELEAILPKTNQFLALDPTAPTEATIGGIIATSDTNSLRQRYGSVRDQLLGITFVRADGQLAKAGGRVVKNVAGYDLMKLFTGSYGTLGIITQATFRLYPVQETSATAVLTGKAEAIAEATSILRGSALTPTQADILSSQMITSLGLGAGLGLIARFQSIAESVKEQSNRLLEVGQKLGLAGVIYSAVDETDLWQKLPQQMSLSSNSEAILCKIGILPTASVEVLTQAEIGFVHMSSGLGMLQFASVERIEEIRNLCQKYNGFLTILAAPTAIKQKLDVWGYRGNGLELMRGIKKQFDPENILSPGRFVGGI